MMTRIYFSVRLAALLACLLFAVSEAAAAPVEIVVA